MLRGELTRGNGAPRGSASMSSRVTGRSEQFRHAVHYGDVTFSTHRFCVLTSEEKTLGA